MTSSPDSSKKVATLVGLHSDLISKASPPSPSSTPATLPSTTTPLEDIKEVEKNGEGTTPVTSSATSKVVAEAQDVDSESDLEDGTLSESMIFPKAKATGGEAGTGKPTPSPLSSEVPIGKDSSPLTKVLEGIKELSEKEQESIRASLERLGGYPEELPLSDTWTLYFSDTSRATKSSHSATQEQYTETQSPLFTVTSVPALCGSLKAYKRLVRSKRARAQDPDTMGLSHFRPGQNLHAFRSYASPTWEDEWNCKGGRITISPPTHLLDPTFERLVLLLAGSSLESKVSDSLLETPPANRKTTGPVIEGLIIGVVASKRARGDRIELWLGGREKSSPAPGEWVDRLKEVLSVELEMPELRNSKFKRHF